MRTAVEPAMVAPGFYRAEGMIKNVNTVEDYRNLDKTAILTQAGRTIWDAIRDGTIYSCPSLLASFVMLSYADLKKYKFTYLFGFPALHSEPVWKFANGSVDKSPIEEAEATVPDRAVHLSGIESTALVESVQTWRYGVDARQYGFFLAKRIWKLSSNGVNDRIPGEKSQSRAIAPEASVHDLGYSWVVGSLAQYMTGFFDHIEAKDQFICFADPSTYKEYPGWMLRNLLVLIDKSWGLNEVQVLCYRDIQPNREDARSMILALVRDERSNTSAIADCGIRVADLPRVSGWERSATGKISSKIANLGEYMNPQRWRISPGLDLDIIKKTKCLLLGAGTLGSYVSRNLLAWGVRKITFVDNGSVSFSNPVRQPLFSFKDCLHGGAKKAHRAAEALKEIYPGVEAEGYILSVPMAGHPIMDEPAVKEEYETLERLIREHDAIFLLMDTRESRWLPTVMGKAAGKIVMNAALGFDSFVVMRHGLDDPTLPEHGLGCYFCNDVVAPSDQCTVTRPGVAAIASALLVEIMVSVLQHPMGGLAPAPMSPNDDRAVHPLGVVPHQIRGFLSTFQNLIIKGNSYDCCSACSTRIIQAYNADGWHFVMKALNEKGYVEDLSGLAEVQRIAEKALADIEISDESDVILDEEPEFI
ncbi:MAG: hypothetical protein LQ337_006146 [Flavoplaca oasis]|nr:MAG: hypothetical protein LQ337_006146 [Flavoplaca oasis]